MRGLALAVAVCAWGGCSLLFSGNDLHGTSAHAGDLASATPHDLALAGGDLAGAAGGDLAGAAPDDMGRGSDGGGVLLACGAPRASIAFVSTPITVGLKPAQLSPGDFNGDGVPDVAVLVEGDPTANVPVPGKVAVLVGDGKGSFGLKGPYTACSNVTSITSGRFSSTGTHRDVVVGCKDATGSVSTNTLLLLKGNGDGTLAAPVGLAAQTFEIDTLLAADLDGNGEDDLVASRYDGAQSAATTVVFFQAAHALGSPVQIAPYSFNHWSAVELNGDGILDLVATYGDASMSVFRSHAGPPIGYTEADYYASNWLDNTWNVPADLDRDGKPDIVVATTDGSGSTNVGAVASWIFDKGTNDFPMNPAETTLSDQTLVDVAAGDFDCDGKIDVVAGSVLDNRLSILRGDGAGGLKVQAGTITVTAPSDIVVADVNGDKLPDLVIGSRNLGSGDNSAVTVLVNVSH